MQPRAIETRYKGYRFRSRLEARWAVFFDALGLEWEYEPEGFDLGDGIRYLPDFRLPALNVWVEIKGAKPDAEALKKPRLMALRNECAVVVYWGLPRTDTWPAETGLVYGWDESGFTEAVECGAIITTESGLALDCFDKPILYGDDIGNTIVPTPSPRNTVSFDMFVRTKRAVEAARSARFEFGEKGAR